MRFSLLSTLYLVSAAVASPTQLQSRDSRIVDKNIKQITASVRALDNLLAKKPNARANIRDLEVFFQRAISANNVVNTDMRYAAEEISRGPILNTLEADKVMTMSLAPNDPVLTRIVNNWIAVKRDADAVRMTGEVLQVLEECRYQTNAFYDAILRKFPNSGVANSSGRTASNKADNNLGRAVSFYRR
jgi:hypothetical protein